MLPFALLGIYGVRIPSSLLGVAHLLEPLLERVQADFRAAFVDVIRVFDRCGVRLAVFIFFKLGSVNLGPSLEHANAIEKISRLPSRNFAGFGGVLKQSEATPLESGPADGMLGNEPSSFSAVFANQIVGGPSDFVQNRFESCRVLFVDCTHLRMVAVAQSAVGKQAAAHFQVVAGQLAEFGAQRFIHG